MTVSRAVQLTLIPITFGVGYATVYDLEINFIGLGIMTYFSLCDAVNIVIIGTHARFLRSVFAVCAVVATSMAQIFTNTYQKSLDCNALQLLYHTSPAIAVVSISVR